MSLADLEHAIVDLCFDRELDPQALGQLPDPRVWRVYREMVRNRLRGELRAAFKRTRAALGDELFERLFVHHLQHAPPTTRFFREVVLQFADAALPVLHSDPTVAAVGVDLLRYEAERWRVSDLPGPSGPAPAEFDFDRVPVLSPALSLLQLGHAVHRDPGDDGCYAVGTFHLCLHRAGDDQPVRVWTLSPVAYDLMQYFVPGRHTVSECIQQVATARGIAVDATFVDGLCGVLADFMERGILLGGR